VYCEEFCDDGTDAYVNEGFSKFVILRKLGEGEGESRGVFQMKSYFTYIWRGQWLGLRVERVECGG